MLQYLFIHRKAKCSGCLTIKFIIQVIITNPFVLYDRVSFTARRCRELSAQTFPNADNCARWNLLRKKAPAAMIAVFLEAILCERSLFRSINFRWYTTVRNRNQVCLSPGRKFLFDKQERCGRGVVWLNKCWSRSIQNSTPAVQTLLKIEIIGFNCFVPVVWYLGEM